MSVAFRFVDTAAAIAALALIAFLVMRRFGGSSLPVNESEPGIEVTALILQVTQELRKAEEYRLSQNNAPVLRLNDVDIEVSYVLRAVRTMTGEVQYKLIALSDTDERTAEYSHKIVLHLSALNDSTLHEGILDNADRPPKAPPTEPR